MKALLIILRLISGIFWLSEEGGGLKLSEIGSGKYLMSQRLAAKPLRRRYVNEYWKGRSIQVDSSTFCSRQSSSVVAAPPSLLGLGLGLL